jgi:hypothetical protein
MPNELQQEREILREADIHGLKYFRKLWPLFERLRGVGCGRDKAGNRQLFMDQYCALVLLFLFNPCVRSLRALQQASQLKNVQRRLACPRASLGSLSEATDVFDPDRLREIIGELAAGIQPMRKVGGEHLDQLLTAVDGSVLKTLSTIAEAAYLKTKQGDSRSAWRLHTHFDIDRGVPTKIDVTSAHNSGKTEEKNMLRSRLEEDHCYVMDRWYAQFTLFNEIHALGSSYVCRVRDNSSYEVLEERPLSTPLRLRPSFRTHSSHWAPRARPRCGPITLCGSCWCNASHTRRRAAAKAARPARQATVSCESRPICWTCRRRSSPTSIGIAGPLSCSFASSSTSWAVGIY